MIRASKQPPHLVLPYRCHRKAPDDINVYTDGSWINPLQQYLGLGGAGVWWPGRDPNAYQRFSNAEKELAHCRLVPKGLMLYTPIGGYSGSSTRTELAAAILAIMANGPVHIGTDSQAFMDRAVTILGKLKQRNKRKRKGNWQTTADGDLWHHFEEAARAKGPHATRISKVKGHVTQEQVNANTHRSVDKEGNDKADQAADIAVETHGKDVVDVARILHRRHNSYMRFMQNVTKHIVEGYLIHRRLIEIEESKQPSKKHRFSTALRTITIITPMLRFAGSTFRGPLTITMASRIRGKLLLMCGRSSKGCSTRNAMINSKQPLGWRCT